MSSLNAGVFQPARATRSLLVKWLVALLVPIIVFTFAWSGEAIINNAILGIFGSASSSFDLGTAIQAAVFIVLFYATVIASGWLSRCS